MGLANRLVGKGEALKTALELAREFASKPQGAVRSDRLSSYEQWSLNLPEALVNEYKHGMVALRTGELRSGLDRYASGQWRSGTSREARANDLGQTLPQAGARLTG